LFFSNKHFSEEKNRFKIERKCIENTTLGVGNRDSKENNENTE